MGKAENRGQRMVQGFLSAYVEFFREVRLQVYKIVNKKLLNEAVVLVEVEAPFIAKKFSRVSLSFSALTNRASAFR